MKEITTAEFENEVLKSEKVVLDFYSTECPPCEALAPKFESVANMFGHKVKFLKIFRQHNRELAAQLGVTSSPTLLFFDKGKLLSPKLSGGIKRSEIINALDCLIDKAEIKTITQDIEPQVTQCDVAILGAGPGGLTAGLYLCQARVNAVLVDIALPGGHVSSTHQVSNYPGFIEPQPGYMLSHNMSEQTRQCGSQYKVAVDVTRVDLVRKEILIDEFETIRAKKIILATGTSPNYLNVPGERELKGSGISYCATCDAKYFVDKEVVVIGGGNSAIEEADFITKFASKVTIVHLLDKLQANKQAQEKAFANPRINFLMSHKTLGFRKEGDKMFVDIEDLTTHEAKTIETDGVFIFIGMKPNTALFGDALKYDQWGYIVTDDVKRTNLPDVFAVGDVTSKKYRQITTAIADGTIAAIAITRELDQ